MTSRQKKGLRGSIDDVLGDLLGDDDDDGAVKVRSPAAGSSRAAGVLPSRSGKRSLLDDDFFSKLAEEAEKEDEGSDVSEADPAALLDSMKNMDDMDADLFSSRKKPSSAPAQSRDSGKQQNKAEPSRPGDQKTEASEEAVPEGKKPSSAPPSTARTYKKFSFLDDDDEGGGLDPPPPNEDNEDDSLDDLLDDLEHKQGEKKTKKSVPPSSSSPAAPQKTEMASPGSSVRKRDDLMFDDDEGDLMNALGFDETPKAKGNGLIQKKESDPPQRARTRLDEILGRGTSPRLLERPNTGERKDTRQPEKPQEKPAEKPAERSSAGKASLLDEEDFTFGSYQPTMASIPDVRQSRRPSVRFSTEDVSSPEHKPKPSTRPTRPRSDWLGLKQDDDEEEEQQKTKDDPKPTASETVKPPASPSSGARKQPSHEKPAAKTTDRQATPPSPPKPAQRQLKREEEEEDWLAGALSRKKTQLISQSEEKERTQEESEGEEREPDTLHSSKPNVSTSRRQQDQPAAPNQELRESTGFSTQPNTSRDTQHKPVLQQKAPAEGAVSLSLPHTPLPADTLQQILIQQQLWGSGSALDLGSQQRHRRDTDRTPGDITSTQARIIQLEGQVRSLQLERDQIQMLFESLQQRHKQDTELMESMHRARVKLLEESAAQREQRSRQENEDLAERLAAAARVAEQERAELQALQQRRLAQCQQDRDREVERLRELQRKSILEMKTDHEDQIQRLKKLKDEEIDAVTSATSQTRSLTVVIEQMEKFSRRLGDLSSRVESTHENTAHGLELGARQRDGQLRVLQDQLSQQQREMTEERSRLKEVIAKMDTQIAEQQRLLEKERWRVTAEQAKAESALRGLEEERRTMMHQFSMEREELEKAKSALLEEQHSVMQHCAEERRKLAAEWTRFHTQEKMHQERAEREASRAIERDAHREGSIISMAQEQAELKLRAGELKQKEESLQKERESLEKLREEMEREKEKLSSTAVRLKTRAHEVESYSKLASERFEEGERALRESRQVEAEHQSRLHHIHTQMERLRQQQESLQQERLKMTDHHREMERTRHTRPVHPFTLRPAALISDFSPALTSTHLPAAAPVPPADVNTSAAELHAKLALIKHTAEKDRDFLQEEQFFLSTLKKTSYNSTFTT